MIKLSSKLPSVGTTIFSVMSKLAEEYHAVNLSQGFPDFNPDTSLIKAVNKAMQSGANQYAPMQGYRPLREIIAEKTATHFQKQYNPETEITITAGGTQAIFTAIGTFIHSGDEVIIFEPAYDSYAPSIRLFGGIVKSFELQAPDYKIDWEMVKKLFTAQTKMIIINTPHNPTGTILHKEDIQALIKLTKDTDIIVLSDEVYAHLIYDNKEHHSVARYPELAERAIIVSSFGKILSATGWKTGYVLAPENLMTEFRKVHQFNVFSVNTPMQVGIAEYLKHSPVYETLPAFFQEKRDFFRNLMQNTVFNLLPCDGSYFQCADYQNISQLNDLEFTENLVKKYGVAAIPVSAFYSRKNEHKIIRFCFAKDNATLEKAAKQLQKVT